MVQMYDKELVTLDVKKYNIKKKYIRFNIELSCNIPYYTPVFYWNILLIYFCSLLTVWKYKI